MRHLRIIVLASVLVVLLGAVATAQSNVATINPLGFIFGMYNLSYETPIADNASVQVDGQYVSWDLEISKYTGFGAGASLRYYPGQAAPHGFYVGPGASVTFVSAEASDIFTGETESESSTAFAASGFAGYQWITDGGFAVNLLAAVHYRFSSLDDVAGFAPGFGLNIGYAW